MGNYTIFGVFENPRRGWQARNLTTNVPKILVGSQIVFLTDIFKKLTMGAPDFSAVSYTHLTLPTKRIV